jgi:PLD-like domain
MPIFLNTPLLNEWIPRLIKESIRELVIVVPYIKTSEYLFQELKNANSRGVETTIIYRENKLTATEKQKFESIDNVNLMHHPNVHCKCYYNEKYLIITSMNLYEYSQINNREMGILLTKEKDGIDIFEDAITEIRQIINGSNIEKQSRETIEEGFEMDIIKTKVEKLEETCIEINKVFIHKKFSPTPLFTSYRIVCENYFDKIDVILDGRAEFILNYPLERIEEIHKKVEKQINEYYFDGYKFYWNHYKSGIYLYSNSKHPSATKIINEKDNYKHIKLGIDNVIAFIRKFI